MPRVPEPPPWSTTQIPIAIVTTSADRKRYRMATDLAEEVGAEAISVDNARIGTGRNHLRAWTWLASGNHPFSVVLEDDSVPVEDFRDQLDQVLEVAPTPIVSLYLGRSHPPHWQNEISKAILPLYEDPCFLIASDLLHGVGYAIRTEMVPQMIDRVQGDVFYRPIDEAISSWAHSIACPVSYARPSIVDHLDGPSLHAPTSWQPRDGIRQAWLWDSRDNWASSTAMIETPTP